MDFRPVLGHSAAHVAGYGMVFCRIRGRGRGVTTPSDRALFVAGGVLFRERFSETS